MTGSFRQAWQYMAADLWEPLAEFTSQNATAPPDLFSDLYVLASEYLVPPPTDNDLEAARNSPEDAREYFLTLIGTDFAGESALVRFLEDAHAVISDYEIPGFPERYRWLLTRALGKYNLRYRLDSPCKLRFLLPGSFTNLYTELTRVNSSNSHLDGLLDDFETAFDDYARGRTASQLKTCIAKASNYAEGLASVTAGIPARGNTLGTLAGQMTDWPHNKVKEALINLYGFCSDYPGIRHAGKPRSSLRNLGIRDATLASLLLLSFSGYLSPNIDEAVVLGL